MMPSEQRSKLVPADRLEVPDETCGPGMYRNDGRRNETKQERRLGVIRSFDDGVKEGTEEAKRPREVESERRGRGDGDEWKRSRRSRTGETKQERGPEERRKKRRRLRKLYQEGRRVLRLLNDSRDGVEQVDLAH